jgi:hypothetical protein
MKESKTADLSHRRNRIARSEVVTCLHPRACSHSGRSPELVYTV